MVITEHCHRAVWWLPEVWWQLLYILCGEARNLCILYRLQMSSALFWDVLLSLFQRTLKLLNIIPAILSLQLNRMDAMYSAAAWWWWQSTSVIFTGCSVTDIMQANPFPKPNEKSLYMTALEIPFRKSTCNIYCIFLQENIAFSDSFGHIYFTIYLKLY